ncbi:MAG: type II secretion system protein GspD [Betaproteobacteria bacterium]|nr:MAG: type II secretion system protein GspD [Betaproteobacteria bacterium]
MKPRRAHSQVQAGAAARAAVRALALALLVGVPIARAADPARGPTPRAAARASEGESVVLNFVNADLEAVVRAVGQFTGRTFVIDPRVKGTLTLVTERPVTRQQAFEQLLSALRLQGFTLVESNEGGGVARILPEADAKLQGGRVVTPAGYAPRGDQVLTQVFRLQYESATNLVPVLRPLIAPNNTISAYPANNTLVITDYAENLRRLARIIEAIDSPATSEVEVVALKYGLATDVATILNKILDEGARSSGQAADPGQRVAVLAEPRTNMLILRAASRARLDQAKELIARFDQPNLTPGNINVVYLRNAQAVKLAPLLRAVLSSDPSFMQQAGGSGLTVTPMSSSLGAQSGTSPQGGSTQGTQQQSSSSGASYSSGGGGGSAGGVAGMIQADPATNSLIISAPEPLYRNIRSIIDRLDVRPAQVMIESLVVELTGQKAAEFGIQWQALNGLTNVSNGNTTQFVGGTNFSNGTGAGSNIVGLSGSILTPAPGLNLGIIQAPDHRRRRGAAGHLYRRFLGGLGHFGQQPGAEQAQLPDQRDRRGRQLRRDQRADPGPGRREPEQGARAGEPAADRPAVPLRHARPHQDADDGVPAAHDHPRRVGSERDCTEPLRLHARPGRAIAPGQSGAAARPVGRGPAAGSAAWASEGGAVPTRCARQAVRG